MTIKHISDMKPYEYALLVEVRDKVYWTHLSHTLRLSVPIVRFCIWFGEQHLTADKLYSEYGSSHDWTLAMINGILNNLILLGYVNVNTTGYQKISAGKIKPTYHLNETFWWKFSQVKVPSFDNANVKNLYVQEEYRLGEFQRSGDAL